MYGSRELSAGVLEIRVLEGWRARVLASWSVESLSIGELEIRVLESLRFEWWSAGDKIAGVQEG